MLAKEAAMTIRARIGVMNSARWLTAAEVVEAAGSNAKNSDVDPNNWKKNGLIFTIDIEGLEYLPGYALDPARQYRPVESLADVIACFEGKKNGWGLAYWFVSVNGALGGRRPQDELIGDPGAVMEAAKVEMAKLRGWVHG